MTNWKNRGTDPPAKHIVPICEFLDISPYHLLTGKEKSSPTVELTNDEQILLNLYKNLSETSKARVLERAITLAEIETPDNNETSKTVSITYYIPTNENSGIQIKKDLNKKIYSISTQVARRTDGKFVKEYVTGELLEKIKALPEDTDY